MIERTSTATRTMSAPPPRGQGAQYVFRKWDVNTRGQARQYSEDWTRARSLQTPARRVGRTAPLTDRWRQRRACQETGVLVFRIFFSLFFERIHRAPLAIVRCQERQASANT